MKNEQKNYIVINTNSELRCSNPNCKKLLGKGIPGTIEIKCPRCKTLCRFKSI